jgi:PIN domain nuclease of toxin-antitoxin system
MESRLALDTHIVIWLYSLDFHQFKPEHLEKIEQSKLFISPMVRVELGLLYEIDRVNEPPEKVLLDLRTRLNISSFNIDFQSVALAADKLSWTRDPFYRLIVATSAATGIPLLTKDRNILTNFDLAAW